MSAVTDGISHFTEGGEWSMSILPTFMQTQIETQTQISSVIEVPKEYGLDFETGQLTGEIVEGIEAIKVWIWLCLHTQRFRWPIYSWDYGADLEQYIGQSITEEFLNADIGKSLSFTRCSYHC